MSTAPADLQRLATLHGVQLRYEDVDGNVQEAGTDALIGVLAALGVDLDGPEDAERALEARRRELVGRRLPPVTAAFDGATVPVELRLPERLADATAGLELELEDGSRHAWTETLASRVPLRVDRLGNDRYPVLSLVLTGLPEGYHRLRVEIDGERSETLLIVAPARVYELPGRRAWGGFLPLWALRTERSVGMGDLTDLRDLGRWIGSLGGAIVGTLPLLPVYLGDGGDGPAAERFDPSPYSPVSRLFWNELFLDLERAPEFATTPRAQELLAGIDRAGLRGGTHVDYRAVARAKGEVLRALADAYFDDPGDRRGDLERFIDARPEVEDYALFRGAVARHGSRWWEWPSGPRDGKLTFDDVDVETARYHLYAQLLAREQVTALADDLRDAGLEPYLDLPVGTNRDGYDAYRYRDVFALDADTGAPPDTIFTGGQNWQFPPLHPERVRDDEYRYLRAVLRHHLELADHLRIDHVMGLHRLYWVPQGHSAKQGVYVRYQADEIYAVLALESHRHRSRIVGEDLGTVPPEVDEALQRRGVSRMYVVQYETRPQEYDVLLPPPADVVASVNTHDMPPFAAWWRARDVDDTVDLGLADEDEARRAREDRGTVRWKITALLQAQDRLDGARADDPPAVHAGLLEWLGASDAPIVLANLEDLWGEERSQNTPGTQSERPNWTRRATYTFEELREHPDVVGPLRRLGDARRGEGEHHG